jgi:hypothetical protein
MLDAAVAAGLEVDPQAYRKHVGVRPGEPLPEDGVLGIVHENPGAWRLLGGWKPRRLQPGDVLHPSVAAKIAVSAYRPRATGAP